MIQKILIGIGLGVGLVACNVGQTTLQNDWNHAELRQKVKLVQTLTTTYWGDQIQKNRSDWDTYVLYNEMGNIIEKKGWALNGNLSYRQERLYDVEGRLVTQTTYTGRKKREERQTFRYDEWGNCIEHKNVSDRKQEITQMVYDESGNLLESTYDRNGHPVHRQVSVFNDKGQLLTYQDYHNDGTLNYESQYSYTNADKTVDIKTVNAEQEELSRLQLKKDEQSNTIERSSFHAGDSLPYKRKQYAYNKKGLETSYKAYVLEQLTVDRTTAYDRKGRVIALKEYKGANQLKEHYTMHYDAKGNLIKKIVYDKAGEATQTLTWEYQYDKERNWIQKKAYEEEILQTITTRNIEYYR